MKISVIRSGVETSISDGVISWLEDWDGLGFPEITRYADQGAQQNGDTDLGFRLEPRYISLVLGVLGGTPSECETKVRALTDLMRPSANSIIFVFELDNGETWRLDGHLYSGGSLPSSDRLNRRYQRVALTFKANEPAFYDPAAETLTVNFGASGEECLVPTPVPTDIGATTIYWAHAFVYGGTFLAYPWIRITGPITDCVITNNATGEKLDFTGHTIAADDFRDIDCRYGYKTLLDKNAANKESELTTDSDLSTFHIADDLEVAGGVNSLLVEGSSCGSATRMDIVFYTRYIGR